MPCGGRLTCGDEGRLLQVHAGKGLLVMKQIGAEDGGAVALLHRGPLWDGQKGARGQYLGTRGDSVSHFLTRNDYTDLMSFSMMRPGLSPSAKLSMCGRAQGKYDAFNNPVALSMRSAKERNGQA